MSPMLGMPLPPGKGPGTSCCGNSPRGSGSWLLGCEERQPVCHVAQLRAAVELEAIEARLRD
eukprot:2173117-Prymnesium_polylepis.1